MFFRDIINSLMKVNCKVTLEQNNYIVRQINLDKIIMEISCLDNEKEQKLMRCYHNLAGVK
ncbi:hypothetical protein NE686_18295 [Tissierella carlieri]|uniref:Uncharacterized protein n=1 Tax=Tissierella carlieri TaxID=689904 RepID=A0ABT1SEZ6_9FIRM|nr:hypothetical protein [Tissierella carlieri]MCQ4925058.1 hypothetical protein [Tissierella carlieri]